MRGDETASMNIVQNLSGNTAALFPLSKRLFLDKTTEETQKQINAKLNKLLFSSDIERRVDPKTGKFTESISEFAKRQDDYMKAVDSDGVKRHLQLNPNIVTKPHTTLRRVEYEKGKFRNEIVPVEGSEEIIESVSLGPMNRRLQKEFLADIKKIK